MGHTRLGEIPKTRKWNDVVREVMGGIMTGPQSIAADMPAIAAKTLDAAQVGLDRAVNDSGVRYTFYLLTQVALASRTKEWESSLGRHGIHLSEDATIFDLTIEVQSAVDRYVGRSSSGATDLSEIAQQSLGEAILSLAGARSGNLFGESSNARLAMRPLSTKKGFGELGQQFFGRFVGRFLNFYLSRVTASQLGGQRLRDLGDVAQFNEALRSHCNQSARIVRDFCGTWYSKTAFEQGINLDNTSGFLAIAMRKLRSELELQKAER